MRFATYLIETHKYLIEKHDVVLQKVLDAVDNGHIEYSESKIAFDIGDLTDTPKLRGLKLVIRTGQTEEVKLGTNKDGEFAIVIHTPNKLPGRQDIDTFLAGKSIYAGFKRAYEKYIKNHHDHDKEYEPNEIENRVKHNSRDTFEEKYNALIAAVHEQNTQYNKAIAEIDSELDKIANVGRKHALELAKEKLKEDFFGSNDKEFISKALALPEAEFAKHLDKEWKEKLESRLRSFYNSNQK